MLRQLIILLIIVINCHTSPIEPPPIIQEEIPIEEENIVVPPPEEKQSLGVYTLTAYCGCVKCCGKTDGITASGAKVQANRTIAAPSSFAFGTKIEINGQTYIVEDRGGAINGKRIDIYFNTHKEALAFGVQKQEIFLIK